MNLPDQKRVDIATTRISVSDEFADMVALSADCHCGSEFHRQELHIEAADDEITVTIYSKIVTDHYFQLDVDDTFWEMFKKHFYNVKWRLVKAASILFKGYAEGHSTFSMTGDDQINDYLDTISRARNKLWVAAQQRKAKKVEQTEQIGDMSDGC